MGKFVYQDLVFIMYSMGKVGSNSFKKILSDNGIAPLQIHYILEYLGDTGEYGPFDRKEKLYDRIRNDREREWMVVSIVREPIARNISAFFWHIDKYYTGDAQRYTPTMAKAFVDNYQHHFALEWFNRELIPFLDFDVYKYPFDHEKGYSIYYPELAELMILRTEDLDRAASEAIEDFFGLADQVIGHENPTTLKPHGEAFLEFHERARFPREFVERMYSSKYAQHFYTDKERAEFIEKWSQRAPIG